MATYSEVLAKIAIHGFSYLKTVTYNSVNYAVFYNSSKSVKWGGTSGTVGMSDTATTYRQIVDYSLKLPTLGSDYLGSWMKYYRQSTNVNMWVPSKELASQITGVTWQGWTCSESDASTAYRSSSGTNSTATKSTSYTGVLVVVNLDDPYISSYGRIVFSGSDYRIWNNYNGDTIIDTD